MKVSNFEGSKNHFIIEAEGRTIFQSYKSVIAIRFRDGRIVLGPNWNYSKTTSKYRNLFLGEDITETRKKIDSGIYTIDQTI